MSGKVAIVTAGAGGIGLAVARSLAKAGACVIIGDKNAEAGATQPARSEPNSSRWTSAAPRTQSA